MFEKHKKYNFNFKKNFGQNFLINKKILLKIVSIINIKNKNILEIGPGSGNLTNFILDKNPKKLVSIEIDKDFYLFLKEKFINFKNFYLINKDALKIKENDLFNNEKINIISNLPYNVGTSLLLKWFKNVYIFENMILLLQKEVVDRIIAKENTKNYGRLSVISQALCVTKKVFNVDNTNFFPKPKIMSSVVFLKIKENVNINLFKLSFLTKELFNNRRKIIKNKLQKLIKNNKLKENIIDFIDLNKRAENITVDEYIKISNYINI